MMTIAEIGQAHEGSLGLALSYIDVFSEAGVDAAKFHVYPPLKANKVSWLDLKFFTFV